MDGKRIAWVSGQHVSGECLGKSCKEDLIEYLRQSRDVQVESWERRSDTSD